LSKGIEVELGEKSSNIYLKSLWIYEIFLGLNYEDMKDLEECLLGNILIQ
jgi:hypothetical protein